jgi:hypothetical protein
MQIRFNPSFTLLGRWDKGNDQGSAIRFLLLYMLT